MIDINNYIEIGYIKRTHGTKGEMAATITRYFPEDSEFIMLLIDGILVPFYVEDWRFKSIDTLLLTLEDIDNEEQAKRLVGCKMFADKYFSQTFGEEYIIEDLIGYQIYTENNHPIGVIKEIDRSTINNLLHLDNDLIIPFHDDFVLMIDHANHSITMKLPDGLITL